MVLIVIRIQKFYCFMICITYFFVSGSIISSTELLTMALFSCCLLNVSLGTRLHARSLVGLLLAYLVPKSPKTLHYSEEFPGPRMRQFFNLPIGLSTCRFLRLPELSPLLGRFYDEADSPLLCLV